MAWQAIGVGRFAAARRIIRGERARTVNRREASFKHAGFWFAQWANAHLRRAPQCARKMLMTGALHLGRSGRCLRGDAAPAAGQLRRPRCTCGPGPADIDFDPAVAVKQVSWLRQSRPRNFVLGDGDSRLMPTAAASSWTNPSANSTVWQNLDVSLGSRALVDDLADTGKHRVVQADKRRSVAAVEQSVDDPRTRFSQLLDRLFNVPARGAIASAAMPLDPHRHFRLPSCRPRHRNQVSPFGCARLALAAHPPHGLKKLSCFHGACRIVRNSTSARMTSSAGCRGQITGWLASSDGE